MNFNNFKKQTNLQFTDKDIKNLNNEINKLSVNGKVNEACQMVSVCNTMTEKYINILEQYHNWLFENFDIQDKH